ncbi:MAG: ABC transporter permease, partial [Pontixanthobacter sp.]
MNDRPTFDMEDNGNGGQTLVLSGPYLVSTMGPIDRELRGLQGAIDRVDLSNVTAIDTVGAWEASRIAHNHDAEITGADERAQRLIDAVRVVEDNAEEPHEPVEEPFYKRVPTTIGDAVVGSLGGTARVLGFFGQILIAFGAVIRHPSRFRGKALIRQMELVGIKALPIVGLMSFLIGIVIAQQGAVQLSQFGAETLTVNLVGR